ncbi:MAG: phosphotransacetylase [Ignavibacteria bacterium]|nr:phosphotransacetylase [Ignavibacteria bacterium]
MILEQLQQRAAAIHATIAFPDALDIRTLRAAIELHGKGLCSPILVGDESAVRTLAKESGVDISNVEIFAPTANATDTANELLQRRSAKGLTSEMANQLSLNPLYSAGQLLSSGKVHAVVAGSISSTADVIRAALYTVGIAPSTKTVSSFFLMVLHDGTAYTYADCGVVPVPTVEQLVDIAFAASENHRALTLQESRVAFLSFSTKGSAQDASVQKMIDAHAMFASRYPHILSDGELQIDAAIVPSVAARKAPLSPIAGNANVLIFPDLNAGNIAYKITERMAGATALGPIIQGLSKPYCDLSRGCSVADIVNVAVIAAVMGAG